MTRQSEALFEGSVLQVEIYSYSCQFYMILYDMQS